MANQYLNKGAVSPGSSCKSKNQSPTADHNQEIAPFPFLLPSSINGPPSPSIFQSPPSKSVVRMNRSLDSNSNMRGFKLSATSQAFTPTPTRPPTPTIADDQIIKQLRQQITDSIRHINILSGQLNSCQMQLQAKTGENAQLHNYIDSLHAKLNDKHQEVHGVTRAGSTTDLDKKLKEEFSMLFREIHNFGMNYYQFPTEGGIQGELRITLRDIVGNDGVAFRLLNDVRTKLIVVAAIVTRFLFGQIFRKEFYQEIMVAMELKGSSGERGFDGLFILQKRFLFLPSFSLSFSPLPRLENLANTSLPS